jgi:hypothetical protein
MAIRIFLIKFIDIVNYQTIFWHRQTAPIISFQHISTKKQMAFNTLEVIEMLVHNHTIFISYFSKSPAIPCVENFAFFIGLYSGSIA